MTATAYERASAGQRFAYAMTRHPLTIATGYITVFFYGMCVRSLVADFRQHIDSALAIIAHVVLGVVLAIYDFDNLVLAMLVPSAIAAAVGAYLFYAQHNYPSVKLHDRAEWDYVAAALESSSFLSMGRMMAWFTGNIGYHHVHHLNAHIPFYRLDEAMEALPELQDAGKTTLSLRDITRCLRLKLWDASVGRLVSFRDRTK
jgi:omega-6 fatty acid desaturase (delta-12 desaturase)